MNTLTKEWLQNTITSIESARDEIPFGLDEDQNNMLTKTAVLVAREFDRKGDWRMKWATYIPGHPDANDGWVVPGASWIPSHWMPLPEPPQEAK